MQWIFGYEFVNGNWVTAVDLSKMSWILSELGIILLYKTVPCVFLLWNFNKLTSFKHTAERTGDVFDSFLLYFYCLYAQTSHNMCDSVTGIFSAELPPPYTTTACPDTGGISVINCRVCQSLINLDGKLHQHVVKCTVCNEATVSEISINKSISCYLTSSLRKYTNNVL